MAGAVGTHGPVLIIGSGLLGASLGLALSRGGIDVFLSDASPTSEQLAVDMGAGRALQTVRTVEPLLVVVATPPDVAGECVVRALQDYPEAVVTDVASVKSAVQQEVLELATSTGDATLAARYVGSHPMAGRERSGAGAADPDLFIGRPWVVVAHEASSNKAIVAVRTLATDVGAVVVQLDASTHDHAVALVSHVPQLVSSLLAARLADAPSEALSLAGQGLRDTTRIAASDSRLWTVILAGNAGPITQVLDALSDDLNALREHLHRAAQGGPLTGGSVGAVNRVMEAGNRGVERIPGKHGGVPVHFAEVEVLVPDEPGELGHLFTELGSIGVNIEDFTVDHAARQRVGVARIMVDPTRAREAEVELVKRGWRIIAHASTE